MTDQEKIEKLETLIKHHNDVYWNKNTREISDEQYDKLVEALRELDPENELVTEFVVPEDVKTGYLGAKLIKHSKPMLSLGKLYSLDEIIKWADKVKRSIDEKFYIQPKYDGMSGLLENGSLSSRGDGKFGQDYTEKLKIITFDTKKQINIEKDTLLGEIIIKNSDFNNIYPNIVSKGGIPFKNQRNGIAGILGCDDVDFYAKQGAVITFVDYDNFGFEIAYKDLSSKWEEIVEKILKVDYPLDGIVIKLADKEYSESLGYTTHHPRGQVAFKFTNQKVESVLEGIEWSMGKSQIGAIGLIKPVEISGITVKRVKLQLTKPKCTGISTCLIDGSLQVGDRVIVERAGDIIPHIISSTPGVHRRVISLSVCPFCGGELEIGESSIKCLNPACKEKKIQNLNSSLITLGFKGIGIAYVKALVEAGFDTLRKILKLKKEDLIGNEFGNKTKDLFISERDKALNECNAIQFLASLNIKELGGATAKLLVNNFNINDIINGNFTLNDLMAINGLGEITSKLIYTGITKNKEAILDCASLFKNLEKKEVKKDGKTICFTGKMEHKRSEMEKIASDRGFIPMDHVDKNLNILVCADPNSGSSKLQKAAKLGIKVISESSFMNGDF